jgi:hypothetical protein
MKPGDIVHIQATVTDVHADSSFGAYVSVSVGGGYKDSVQTKDIIKHIPAPPPPLKVGDKFRYLYDGKPSGTVYEVLFVHKSQLFVKAEEVCYSCYAPKEAGIERVTST